MGKRREPMSEGKKNIIAGLLQEYDIHSAEDIAVDGIEFMVDYLVLSS